MKKEEAVYYATGRRKESVARVRLYPGEGKVIINKRPMDEYFPIERLRLAVKKPFIITETADKFNVQAKVEGGGISGQADAVKLGIARALVLVSSDLRLALRKAGLLTRDPRKKERKKYGRKRARKRFQYSKR